MLVELRMHACMFVQYCAVALEVFRDSHVDLLECKPVFMCLCLCVYVCVCVWAGGRVACVCWRAWNAATRQGMCAAVHFCSWGYIFMACK
jgi:energy-converting hydrogenase Eha subunit G